MICCRQYVNYMYCMQNLSSNMIYLFILERQEDLIQVCGFCVLGYSQSFTKKATASIVGSG